MKNLCIVCLLVVGSSAVACGPFLPPSYLQGKGNGYTPKIDLGRELKLIAESRTPQHVKEFPVGGKSRGEAEIADFRDALKEHGISGSGMEALVSDYAVWQEQARSPDGPPPPGTGKHARGTARVCSLCKRRA